MGNIEAVIFVCTAFIPMGVMYLHARTLFTLAHTTIPMGVIYLHARMFCTLAHTSSIPMGAMYLYMQERFLHLLIRSIPKAGTNFYHNNRSLAPC